MLPVKILPVLLAALLAAGCVDDSNSGHAGNPAARAAISTATAGPVSGTTVQIQLPATGFPGEFLTLNASGGSDVASWQWSVQTPDGQRVYPADANFPQAVLQPEKIGTYQISLTTTDRQGRSSSAGGQLHVIGKPRRLAFNLLDAEYSSALDSIVAVSNQPDNALYVLNAATGTGKKIPLTYAPTAVAVSPDGKQAVVGHDAALTRIDLQAGKAIPPLVSLNFEVFDVALSNAGIAYASAPDYGQWDSLYEVNLQTGLSQPALSDVFLLFAGGAHLQYQQPAQAVYTLDSGLLPIDLNHFDTRQSPLHWSQESPYQGEYNMGGKPTPSNLWLSEDGKALLTSGGSLFQVSTDKEADMTYLRSLSDFPAESGQYGLIHANHSAEAARFVTAQLVEGAQAEQREYRLSTYKTPGLQLDNTLVLTGLDFSATREPVIPQFVFYNAAGTQRYGLLKQGTDTWLLAF